MSNLLHVALFPLLSKGHTIPLLQLVKLIHSHRSEAKFTVFTTPSNEPFIVSSLSSLPSHLINIVSFPFPSSSDIIEKVNDNGQLPLATPLKIVESTGQLPSTERVDNVLENTNFSKSRSEGVENTSQLPLLNGVESTGQIPSVKKVENTDQLPLISLLKGIESTGQFPSISHFFPFLKILERLQPKFEIALKSIQDQEHPITCLVSDGFLHWTQESASKFNIPRLVFYGMNNYSSLLNSIIIETRPFLQVESLDEVITFPNLPRIQVTRNDFESPWSEQDPKGLPIEYMIKCCIANSNSYGILVNSFYELEPQYVDYWNLKFQPKAWCIGPLCLAEKSELDCFDKPNWMEWLNNKWAEQRPVLYVAFGSQAEVSNEQLKEIMIGLENSGVDFIWALRVKPNQEKVIGGLKERVEGRGLIERGWVDQKKILSHKAIQGFLSHCGWNSVTDSVCASVPLLTFPMMAEQHLNTRFIVDEMKVGLRVNTCNGSVRGFVKWEELSKGITELMFAENGKMVKENVEKLAKVANKAIQEGGSSWNSLEKLLFKLQMM